MDNEDQISTLRSICEGISNERAQELWEAGNGSLERAIDIFFHQQHHHDDNGEAKAEHDTACVPVPPPAVEKKRSPSKQSTSSPENSTVRRKQARLDAFLGRTSPQHKNAAVCKVASPEIIAIDDDDDDDDDDDNEDPYNVGPSHGQVERSRTTLLELTPVSEPSPSEDKDEIRMPTLPKPETEPSPPKLLEPTTIASKQLQSLSGEIPFQTLAETLQKLTDTTKRLVKLNVLKEFVVHVVAQEPALESRVATLTNSIQMVLGFRGESDEPLAIGGSALSKALQTVLGTSRTQLSKAYREYGDMGDVAASLFQKKTLFVTTKSKVMSIGKVHQAFSKIVGTDGRDAKHNILVQLLRECNTKVEIRFLVRLLIGNTRVGANLKTILAALGLAVEPSDAKRATEIIQKTHDICPKLDRIIQALLVGGIDKVRKDCGTIQVLTPISPMLAHPTHSLDQVAKVMKQADGTELPMTMEYKYDGVRCQAHFDGRITRLFSRHMLETTAQYPDAVKAILEARRSDDETRSFVLDAEIVGVENDGADVRLLPFQDLSRRKKTADGNGVRIKVFCFDLMFVNGISYIDKPLRERQAKLQEHFAETKDFAFVTSRSLPTFDETRIRAFLEESVAKGTEGLMLKLLGNSEAPDVEEADNGTHQLETKKLSLYEAGTRSHSWLKVKRDYVAGYADTIDVVPIGAWYGNGRKAQMSFLSPVLLAVYDDEEDVYRSVSRCMSFTDAMYASMREFYFRGTPYPPNVGIADVGVETEPLVLDDDEIVPTYEAQPSLVCDRETETCPMVNCFPHRPSSAYVVTNESPPLWFKPMEVFEVSFADMSLSRQHTAGAGLVDDPEGRGVALRFPRFKRRRPDKRPDQATTSLQVAQMFAQQSKQYSDNRNRHS